MLTPYSIKVYLNKEKSSKDGKCPIYIRVICNRKKTELSTNIFVLEKQWDPTRLIIKKEPALNDEINSILSEINGWMKLMASTGGEIQLSEVRKLVRGNSSVIVTIADYIKQYLLATEKNTTIKQTSVIQYKATIKYLEVFFAPNKLWLDTLASNRPKTYHGF